MEYVISATLSSFELGTWFYTKDKGSLRERLIALYENVEHSLIENHMVDRNESRDSIARNRVGNILSAHCYYGQRIGLSNWGFNYDFQIDPRFQKVRAQILDEAQGVLGKENFNFFKKLGKKLNDD